jgi:hypothetical protein
MAIRSKSRFFFVVSFGMRKTISRTSSKCSKTDWRWFVHNCLKIDLTKVENVKEPGGQKKGEQFCVELAHLMPLAVVLRSWVAPLRCPLSYTSAKVRKVLDITKSFPRKVAKKGKVSRKVGQKRGETSQFHP